MRVSRRISIVAALLAVTVLAGLAALVGSSSSQASPQASQGHVSGLARQRHRQVQRPFVQPVAEGRADPRPLEAGRQDQGAAVELDFGLHSELDAGSPAALEPHHLGRLPARRRDEHGREEVPEDPLRDHRLLGQGRAVQRSQERDGSDVRGQRVRLPGRRPRRQDGPEDRQEGHRRGRRPEDPAGRHLDRRATSSAPRRRSRARRSWSTTRRTSSRPTSARRSPRT